MESASVRSKDGTEYVLNVSPFGEFDLPLPRSRWMQWSDGTVGALGFVELAVNRLGYGGRWSVELADRESNVFTSRVVPNRRSAFALAEVIATRVRQVNQVTASTFAQ